MIDLHLHSTFSDGTCTPEEVAALAADAGLSAAVLTDHDTWGGWPRFAAAARARGLRTATGMEISADVPGRTVHMLAYGFDPDAPALAAAAEKLREGRRVRNASILAKLARLGCPVSAADVAREAGSPDLVARPHIANALVRRGFARDRADAFRRFLERGAPAYEDRVRLDPEEAVRLVRAAGGAAVLAHPFSARFGRAELRAFVARLAAAGLAGLEVHYTGHLPAQVEELSGLAREFGLVAAGGSDFHGANKPNVRVGVAYGGLKVPDEAFDALLARASSGAG
ncbi:MAG: PHP domain-containing protein [Kiritimatiellae bacterium]|nr:PHP domain-containing protein [Kiritimatiellia bacterium]